MTARGFLAQVPVILLLEGVDADLEHDRGGRTRYGISSWTWRRWLELTSQPADRPIEELDREEATTIYRALYWTPGRCSSLPWPLDLVHLDSMVQHQRAPQLLQEVLGVAADGILGPVTLAAARARPAIELAEDLLWRRAAYYRELWRDPSQLSHARGWIGRLIDLRAFVTGRSPLPAPLHFPPAAMAAPTE